jgi:hypothetical protein
MMLYFIAAQGVDLFLKRFGWKWTLTIIAIPLSSILCYQALIAIPRLKVNFNQTCDAATGICSDHYMIAEDVLIPLLRDNQEIALLKHEGQPFQNIRDSYFEALPYLYQRFNAEKMRFDPDMIRYIEPDNFKLEDDTEEIILITQKKEYCQNSSIWRYVEIEPKTTFRSWYGGEVYTCDLINSKRVTLP